MNEKTAELFDVSGKVVAITGGGGVLCGAMAQGLAARGVKVAVLDIRLEFAEKVAAAIRAAGGEATAAEANVLDKASVQAAAQQVVDTYGGIDILINGAGGNKKEATTGPDLSFFDLPPDAVQWVFNLNFIGSLLPSQVFGKLIVERGAGSIINISSMNAFKPLTKIPAYSGAKAAVSNFTQWLAVHMAQNYSKAVRVNAIAPGFFETEQNRFLLRDEKTGNLTPRGQVIIDHTPMGRYGAPEDLLGTLLWLVSPASGFVTGIVVPVDGGFSAFSGV
ncbi:MAG: SDR family oxidoreductase [Kiritimatiellae bacterium]|nr:SDR family oxidoreductase [Kiritimatiellia bacterium]